MYIGKDLPSEYTQSEYTKSLLKNEQGKFNAKKKAIGSFGEIIESAANRRWKKTKHPENKDAKYGVYKHSSSFAFPVRRNGSVTNVRAYDVDLVILNSSDGKKCLYDIVNIKENTAAEYELLSRAQRQQNAAARHGVSESSVSASTENVNEKLSAEASAANLYSLEPVKPIQPKSPEWQRSSTTEEVRAMRPQLRAVDAESSETRNPTQIKGTVKSYRKIYDA